ncbi:AbrB family transcriptional regulator [Azospirillum sp.]|uniref:AbrB family transcriptional regulator n=1 Tax=Azospirillum sp. TaxID=34012 RepID=UPI002D4C23B1|nr:AbrB family transcriptional regulator [Azospirillum sp.]HYD66558.1 AbrB family transcriptional regulator [Azospirillum sp.]
MAHSSPEKKKISHVGRIARTALGLAAGAGGGYAFQVMDLPLAWMLGAMCASMALSLPGMKVTIPRRLNNFMLAVIGVLLGSTFTPELFGDALRWLPSIGIMISSQIVMGAILVFICYKLFRYDPPTAYFAPCPGALSQVAVLAPEYGADVRKVALCHGTRVFAIALVIPLLVSWLILKPEGAAAPIATGIAQHLSVNDIVLLTACALVGPSFAIGWKLPNPSLFGPIILSALLHMTESTRAMPPMELVNAAQVVIGVGIGGKFAGTTRTELRKIMGVAIFISAFMLAWAFGMAFVMAKATGLSVAASLLIMAPGGLAEMSVVALTMSVEPAVVGIHHVIRICIYLGLVPSLFFFWRWILMGKKELSAKLRLAN